MKIVVCTGISGSERISCLRETQEYAKERGTELEIINMWDIVNEISARTIDEATILNVSSDSRMQLFECALKEIVERLGKLRQQESQNKEKCTVIATHALFHWRSTYLKAFPYYQLPSLDANLFVTVVHNMKDIKKNLDTNASHRFVGIKHVDILYWQDHEITETRRWAETLGKEHLVVARNEPAQTMYKILFEEKAKRVYFSYPMSFVEAQQIEGAKKLIDELREAGYIVFDPGSVDDAKYVDELLASAPENPEYQDLGRRVDDQTVKQDFVLIDQSQLLVARYPAAMFQSYNNHSESMYIPLSAGVICEMVYAHNQGKRVYAVWLPEKSPSPFFIYHCREYLASEDKLLDYLVKYEPPLS